MHGNLTHNFMRHVDGICSSNKHLTHNIHGDWSNKKRNRVQLATISGLLPGQFVAICDDLRVLSACLASAIPCAVHCLHLGLYCLCFIPRFLFIKRPMFNQTSVILTCYLCIIYPWLQFLSNIIFGSWCLITRVLYPSIPTNSDEVGVWKDIHCNHRYICHKIL